MENCPQYLAPGLRSLELSVNVFPSSLVLDVDLLRKSLPANYLELRLAAHRGEAFQFQLSRIAVFDLVFKY